MLRAICKTIRGQGAPCQNGIEWGAYWVVEHFVLLERCDGKLFV